MASGDLSATKLPIKSDGRGKRERESENEPIPARASGYSVQRAVILK